MNKCAVGIFWRFAQRLFYLTVIDRRLQVSKVTMGTTVHVRIQLPPFYLYDLINIHVVEICSHDAKA